MLEFINKLKVRLVHKYPHLNESICMTDMYNIALNKLVSWEQKIYFENEYDYLTNRKNSGSMPGLVSKMNLYSEDGVIKVKSKFENYSSQNHPILLPKQSFLTYLIVQWIHEETNHGGVYSVLRFLRQNYYIIHIYSVVRNVIRKCVICRRFNSKPIALNQSFYRENRIKPSEKPFTDIYLDYCGPFLVELKGEKFKVWLLVITCMFSRAVNLVICRDYSTEAFLRAIQIHVYSYGLFSNCTSDLGSQIKSGANAITAYLNDVETRNYFESSGINFVKFVNYPKGNSALGSMVECLVKQTKLLIKKSIKNIVLEYFDFEISIN